MIVEAEICAAASEVLTKLGFNDFCSAAQSPEGVDGNSRELRVFRWSNHDSALIALDKLDKIGREGVKKEFAHAVINEVAGERCLSFFSDLGPLEQAAEIVAEEELAGKH